MALKKSHAVVCLEDPVSQDLKQIELFSADRENIMYLFSIS